MHHQSSLVTLGEENFFSMCIEMAMKNDSICFVHSSLSQIWMAKKSIAIYESASNDILSFLESREMYLRMRNDKQIKNRVLPKCWTTQI